MPPKISKLKEKKRKRIIKIKKKIKEK